MSDRKLGPKAVVATLKTRWLGRPYRYFDLVDSTNIEARLLVDAGLPHGTVIVADAQRAGRGRLGRVWQSPPGKNIYLSAILRPEAIAPVRAPLFGLAIACGLAEALSPLVGDATIGLKWPNDLLVGQRKLCGVLMELRTRGGKTSALIAGVGINVNCDPTADLSGDVAGRATSLSALGGVERSRLKVLCACLLGIEGACDRLMRGETRSLIDAFCQRACYLGEPVRLLLADGVLEGIATGLDDDGALLLRDERGRTRRILAGDLRRLRP